MAIRPAVFRHQDIHTMLECCVTFAKLRNSLGLGFIKVRLRNFCRFNIHSSILSLTEEWLLYIDRFY